MPETQRWEDLTRPLPPTFNGQSRETIFEAWETHFKEHDIKTRRVKLKIREIRSYKGRYRYKLGYEKLQIQIKEIEKKGKAATGGREV